MLTEIYNSIISWKNEIENILQFKFCVLLINPPPTPISDHVIYSSSPIMVILLIMGANFSRGYTMGKSINLYTWLAFPL